MEFLIVTGLSGAGKSRAITALEDIGYYCVDNMPPSLISKFYQLCQAKSEITKVAIVTDIRGGDMFGGISAELEQLKSEKKEYKIMFLDADNDTILNRFKETRRRHPFSERYMGAISQAIEAERTALEPIRELSDYIIDTTQMTPLDLKQRISALFLQNQSKSLLVHLITFGFKNGLPSEADMVFDVRCLPNPFYLDELKPLTGLDPEVSGYIMNFPQSIELLTRMTALLDFLIPLYEGEGKTQFIIAVGCTGGKHRSVTIAHEIFNHVEKSGKRVSISHRDILKK